MANETTAQAFSDEVQIFDVAESVLKRDHISGRVDMAKSPNSFVAVFQTKPRGGEAHIHQHPDSDQILFLLKGELTLESLSGKYSLKPNQGVMIPPACINGFINTSDQERFFSRRGPISTAAGAWLTWPRSVGCFTARRRAPSPAAASAAISTLCARPHRRWCLAILLEEWNKASLLE